jgi:hypothetical protein
VCGSCGSAPAWQGQGPEFKPQYCQKKERNAIDFDVVSFYPATLKNLLALGSSISFIDFFRFLKIGNHVICKLIEFASSFFLDVFYFFFLPCCPG